MVTITVYCPHWVLDHCLRVRRFHNAVIVTMVSPSLNVLPLLYHVILFLATTDFR